MDIQIQHKKGLRKKHIPYIVGGTLVIILIIWLIMSNGRGTMRVDSGEISIVNVQKGQFDDYVRLDGKVLPISIVRLTPEEGGIVKEKVLEEGTQVKKGDVIVRLSNSSLELSILEAQNSLVEKQSIVRNQALTVEQNILRDKLSLKDADIKMRRAQRSFKQQEKLYSENLTSKENYDQAKEEDVS